MALFLASCASNVEIPSSALHVRAYAGHADWPPLVMLNGIPATSSIYDGLIEEIQRRMPVAIYQVDLPGTGASRAPDSRNITWSLQRQYLREFLIGLPPFVLVVHDIAGPVALPLVAELPEQTQGVIVFNTIIRTEGFSPVFPMRMMRTPFVGSALASMLPFQFYARMFERYGFHHPERVDREWLRRIHRELTAHGGKRRLAAILRGFESGELTDRLIADGLSQSPRILAIWAMSDPSLGPQEENLPSGDPRWNVHTIDSARHFLMMDYREEVAQIIADWLFGEFGR